MFPPLQCGGGGLFDSFVMTVVASEDVSRPAWPSCPAQGWSSGVDRLTSFPNGQPMHTAGKSAVVPGRAAASDEVAARVVGACVGSTATCTSYTGLDYAQGVINKTAAAKTAQECCDACAADSTCFAASFVASTATCWFKPDGGKSFTWTDGVTSVFPPGHAAPPLPVRTIEVVSTGTAGATKACACTRAGCPLQQPAATPRRHSASASRPPATPNLRRPGLCLPRPPLRI